MYRYILCVSICAVVWIVNGRWIIQAVREDVTSEIYIHTGLGIFFTLLVLEIILGLPKVWMRFDLLSILVCMVLFVSP